MNTKETAEHLSKLLDATISVRQVIGWINGGSLVAQNLNISGERPIYNVTKSECERFRMAREIQSSRPARQPSRQSYPVHPWVTC
jgi:hypothetical protein